MGGGINRGTADAVLHFARQRVEFTEAFNFIPEQLHPDGDTIRLRREDIDDIATHTEGGAVQLVVVACVLQLGEALEHRPLIHDRTQTQMQYHSVIRLRVPQAVDRRYRGDDDGVRPLQQRLGGGQSHLLDLFVDGGVFLDVRVRRRHIGLGLIVIVVRYEILHGVVRKEVAHLGVQLGRQGLVRCHHQGRTLQTLHHIGDGVGLARTGHPE